MTPSPSLAVVALALLLAVAPLVGCHGGKLWLNPWHRPDRTAYVTPAKRIQALQAEARRADSLDEDARAKAVETLVRELQGEEDPLVREAQLEAIAEYNTPLSRQALLAGLGDNDPEVRIFCCGLLARRPGAEAGPHLARVARTDGDFDVRVAAIRALGSADDEASRSALVAVLEDPDPAMQYVGVEAMRRLTGRDLGGDVQAYLALAKGQTGDGQEKPTAVANRRPGWLPFF